jgi:hypothetical protein
MGVKQAEYWRRLREANRHIGQWLESRGKSEAPYVLKAPTPVSYAKYVAPMELPDLVPLSDQRHSVQHAEKPCWWRPQQEGMKFLIHARMGEKIRFRIEHGRPKRGRHVQYLLSGIDGRDLARGEVGPGKTETVEATAFRDGVYQLRAGSEGVWFHVLIDNPHVAAVAPFSLIWQIEPFYFYVPRGTKAFHIAIAATGVSEDAWLQVYAPDGRAVVDKADAFDKRMTFPITVPPDADGKVWRLEIKQPEWGNLEDVRLSCDGIPPYFATHPDRLVVPGKP